jgi:hypothetical protein
LDFPKDKHPIIGIPDFPGPPAEVGLADPGKPLINHVMQIDIRQHG